MSTHSNDPSTFADPESPAVRLAFADPPDADELSRVQTLAFADHVTRYGKGPPGFDIPEAQIRAMRMAIYHKILVDEEIVGGMIVRARDESAGHYYLIRMFLNPSFHGRGVGTKAFHALEKKFSHVAKWTLDTPYLCLRNHHFYSKLGFIKIGETTPSEHPLIPDPDFRLFLYEKTYPQAPIPLSSR